MGHTLVLLRITLGEIEMKKVISEVLLIAIIVVFGTGEKKKDAYADVGRIIFLEFAASAYGFGNNFTGIKEKSNVECLEISTASQNDTTTGSSVVVKHHQTEDIIEEEKSGEEREEEQRMKIWIRDSSTIMRIVKGAYDLRWRMDDTTAKQEENKRRMVGALRKINTEYCGKEITIENAVVSDVVSAGGKFKILYVIPNPDNPEDNYFGGICAEGHCSSNNFIERKLLFIKLNKIVSGMPNLNKGDKTHVSGKIRKVNFRNGLVGEAEIYIE